MGQGTQRWTNPTLRFVSFIKQIKDARAAAIPLNHIYLKVTAF